MEQKLLNDINEALSTNYTSLKDAQAQHSPRELLDAWLSYEGIIGYTDQILRIICKLGIAEPDSIEDDDFLSD